MGLGSVQASIDNYNHGLVAVETWGHLAPEKNKTYRGTVVFALGCFGSDNLNPTILACEMPKLDSSPWFFDSLSDFIKDLGGAAGEVYRVKIMMCNYKFQGKKELVFKS